jgi:hypothetical protein
MEGKASMIYEQNQGFEFKMGWVCLAVIIAVMILM